MPSRYTTKDVRRLLRKVRTRLLNGKIKKAEFDIESIFVPACGTPGCIGGWCLALDGRREGTDLYELTERADGHDDELQSLFFDFPSKSVITPSRAARAITRYLDGKRPWPHSVSSLTDR